MIVGIPACAKTISDMPFHHTPARYAQAVLGGAGALPVLIPPLGEPMLGLLDDLDGLLVPGSPSNVHPSHYDGGDSETPDLHDLERDHTTLPLIRAAIGARHPGAGDLPRHPGAERGARRHRCIQRVHTLEARMDHRGGPGPHETRYGPKHLVTVTGSLARIVGADRIEVNSLHGQAIDRLGDGLVVEAWAPDGTIEAVAMPSAPGWVLGVQWHPEWAFAEQPPQCCYFRGFRRCVPHTAA